VSNSPDPHSENSSDYCGEEESEVENAFARGREGEVLRADKKVECEKNGKKISGLKR
jgi:hypothetical protein